MFKNILLVIIFIIALATLISIHELGHFIFAKLFNVYVDDFSIGFGPKIFRISKKGESKKSALILLNSKKNETDFSIGIIPLGGYVRLLDEPNAEFAKDKGDLKGRSVSEKKFIERLLINFGGILMNFILAFVMFFISSSCFVQYKNYGYNVFNVNDSVMVKESLTSDEEGNVPLEFETFYETENNEAKNYYVFYVSLFKNNSIQIINDPTIPVTVEGDDSYYALVFDSESVSLNDIDYSNCFRLARAKETSEYDSNNNEQTYYLPEIDSDGYDFYNFKKGDVIKPILIKIKYINNNEEVNQFNAYLHLKINDNGKVKNLGFGIYFIQYKNSFGGALKDSVITFGNSTTLIGKTLLSLFYDKSAWDNVGGPISIFTQTSTIFNNYPFNYYLETWGMISVNLALFNFIPFPGLDGWAILVTLIEGIVNAFKNKNSKIKDRKDNFSEYVIGEPKKEVEEWKFPSKIKNIISIIGLVIVFAIMAFVFIKDIGGLF